MDNILAQQVAVITGGTAGLGKAIALKLAAHGAYVVLLGTNLERGAKVVEEICSNTHECRAAFFQVDVANTEEVASALKTILDQKNQIDILINNAGITSDQLLMKMTEDDWDRVMDVNVKSCYNTCKMVVRPMMKARKGKIINISSVVGLTGNAGQANYAASKAAVIGFTKSLAKELAPRNICVNCIAPGFIQTRMTDVLTDDQKQSILEKIPLGRFGEVEDIANIVLFFASPLADYITGQVVAVDGGMV